MTALKARRRFFACQEHQKGLPLTLCCGRPIEVSITDNDTPSEKSHSTVPEPSAKTSLLTGDGQECE
jgi:hypothetical protein